MSQSERVSNRDTYLTTKTRASKPNRTLKGREVMNNVTYKATQSIAVSPGESYRIERVSLVSVDSWLVCRQRTAEE